MLTALKRIVGNNNNNNGGTTTTTTTPSQSAPSNNTSGQQQQIQNGLQTIPQNLQKKFAKGVNYNMKIVIRGDCNTGKSTLWLRLQGQPFRELYEPSEEIRVANINWNSNINDSNIVKVEIWDVVDKSKKKRQLTPANSSKGLKLDNDPNQVVQPSAVEVSLDAEFIDVYKNANGCIMVYDITKQWTWDYIERELPKVPSHIPVLVLGNHKDMHHHRTVHEMKCRYFVENLQRGNMGSIVRYTEGSMRNGFGLSYLYKFLNLPYLQLQRETLMQQLETNAKEMDSVNEELGTFEGNMDDDYKTFSENLNSKRRVQSEKLAADVLKNAKTIEEAKKDKEEAEKAATAAAAAQMSDSKKMINNIIGKITPKSLVNTQQQSTSPNNNQTSPSTVTTNTTKKTEKNTLEEILPGAVEEFNKFLEESPKQLESFAKYDAENDEDDDDDLHPNGNPMVSKLKENIDSESDDGKRATKPKIVVKKDESSDDDEGLVLSKSNISKMNEKPAPKKNSSNIKTTKKENDQNSYILLNNSTNSNSSIGGSSNSNSNKVLDDFFQQTSDKTPKSSKKVDESNIKLTNDDFEFLEKLATNNSHTNSSSNLLSAKGQDERDDDDVSEEEAKSEKKKKKKSSKTKSSSTDDNNNSESKNKKLHKSKKHSKKSNDDVETNSVSSSSTYSSKKKSHSSKSDSKKHNNNNNKLSVDNIASHNNFNENDDDDDGDGPKIHVKADCDYEEL